MVKKTFRDGAYYRHVLVGKRTVKEGECAAVWTPSGDRKLIEGPKRVRLWFSHVRFLDRYVADGSQYLLVQFRDGRNEHLHGPVAHFFDPCVHERMEVKNAFKLAANEALVVYAEKAKLSRAKLDPEVEGVMTVQRRVVSGPAVFIPAAHEWIHNFSWHGSPGSGSKQGTGSKTGTPGDTKVPHGAQFQVLRSMPDQIYCTVRDVRTSDDAQLTVNLMIFYELRDIERMLDTSNDPLGDFISAVSADVMTFGAANTYESFLAKTSCLSDIAAYPVLASRMQACGFALIKCVYRGYTTCAELQRMHDTAVAERTRLRLETHTAKEQEAQRALELHSRQERSRNEQALAAAEAEHALSLLRVKNEAGRHESDALHEQELRHARAKAAVEAELQRARNDEELRRVGELGSLGVDLTKFLVAVESAKPDRHVRVDAEPGTALHLDMGRK